MIFVAVIFIISKIKPSFKSIIDSTTVLLLFGITFTWYSFISISLTMLTGTIQRTINVLLSGQSGFQAGTAAGLFAIPETFTSASWINLAVSGIAYLFLIIGALVVIFKSEKIGISKQYRLLSIVAAIILVVSLAVPDIAAILNFTRFYGITLLFLSPCFVIGGMTLLETIKGTLMTLKKSPKLQLNFRPSTSKKVLVLIAVLLGAYFLSQSGFVNYTTGGAIHSLTIDYDRMKADPRYTTQFYSIYMQEQDVFSAVWLWKNVNVSSTTVYSDSLSANHELVSYGLIPNRLILPLSNVTIPAQGSLVYLSTLNIINGVVPASTNLYNITEISSSIEGNNVIYSNGNSAILRANGGD